MNFIADQRLRQIEFRSSSNTFSKPDQRSGAAQPRHYDFVLPDEIWHENLAPEIRTSAINYFSKNEIEWHRWRHHLLSSQICCLNFLMPFVRQPDALAQLLAPIFGSIDMLPIEGEDCFVAFEWIGGDYLNESRDGVRTRGAHCTSADAAVRFRRAGRTHVLLIEWKYTESYGASPAPSAEQTRRRRYEKLVFAPDGPLKSQSMFGLTDLFYEPFYQLLRQQMLAFQLERHRECDEASVLHIAPAHNRAIHRVTSRRLQSEGVDAYTLWPTLLADPGTFASRTTGAVFARLVEQPSGGLEEWAQYISGRYGSILN